MLMKQGKLIEKHAEAQGVQDLKVRWVQVSGGSTINDGLISGAIDIAAVGDPPLMVLWSKTDGANAVRGIASLNSYPMYLNTRNPNVRSIQAFTNESRIAVPQVKTGRA